MVVLLLDRGASLSTRTSEGATPLHLAAQGGDLALFRLLLDRGADIHALSNVHRSALHIAVRNKNLPMARELLARGSDCMQLDRSGHAPLHYAVKSVEMLAELLKSVNGSLRETPIGDTIIAEASGNGATDPEIIPILVARGANIDGISCYGHSAMNFAILDWRQDFLKKLIEQGADPDAGSPRPLILAARNGQSEMCKLLLENGARLWSQGDAAEEDVCGMFASFSERVQQVIGRAAEEHWSLLRHGNFGVECRRTVITVLLCAKRRGLELPQELWFCIFEFFRRRDFGPGPGV
eukprot:m.183388 g.183388  ORF g.183388 m.183388 type:complete len:295 (-) comp10494_c0_seq5:68-952(-)